MKNSLFLFSFNKITECYLPFVPTILDKLSDVPQTRIDATNQYILDIYFHEYNILKHISNLRSVFLLGAGDLMLNFYSNLFRQVSPKLHSVFLFFLQ